MRQIFVQTLLIADTHYISTRSKMIITLQTKPNQGTMDEIHSPRLTMVWPGFEPVISWCVWSTLPPYRLSYRFDSITGKNGVQKCNFLQFSTVFHTLDLVRINHWCHIYLEKLNSFTPHHPPPSIFWLEKYPFYLIKLQLIVMGWLI